MLRSTWFLATALDKTRPPYEREAAWRLSDREFWFESVLLRKLPLMYAPAEHVPQIRALILQRHEGPLSGFQIKR